MMKSSRLQDTPSGSRNVSAKTSSQSTAPNSGARNSRTKTLPPGLHILLTDDSKVNLMVTEKLLSSWGHHVQLAENGLKALMLCEKYIFDIILMDCEMPEMDGREATKAIRALEEPTGRHTPIIAMTGHVGQEGRDLCLTAGMDLYLAKPIKSVDLQAALEKGITFKRP